MRFIREKHTLKTQVLTTLTGKILAVSVDKGRTHDYKLFKESRISRKITMNKVLADLGYKGLHKLCPNTQIPNKKTKLHPLIKGDKKENHKLSSKRIIVEQINAKIKVFKITKYPYRNRRKKFGLRMNFICALINLDARTAVTEENEI